MGDMVHADEDIVDDDVGGVIWRFLVDFFLFFVGAMIFWYKEKFRFFLQR